MATTMGTGGASIITIIWRKVGILRLELDMKDCSEMFFVILLQVILTLCRQQSMPISTTLTGTTIRRTKSGISRFSTRRTPVHNNNFPRGFIRFSFEYSIRIYKSIKKLIFTTGLGLSGLTSERPKYASWLGSSSGVPQDGLILALIL